MDWLNSVYDWCEHRRWQLLIACWAILLGAPLMQSALTEAPIKEPLRILGVEVLRHIALALH